MFSQVSHSIFIPKPFPLLTEAYRNEKLEESIFGTGESCPLLEGKKINIAPRNLFILKLCNEGELVMVDEVCGWGYGR